MKTIADFPEFISRREALRRSVHGAAGLLLASRWGVRAWAGTRPAKAKSIIQICNVSTKTFTIKFPCSPGMGIAESL